MGYIGKHEKIAGLTPALALELLDRAVAEKGEEYVDPGAVDGPETSGCVYFRDGAPACIVGHVFSYLGITLDDFPNGLNDEPDQYGAVDEVLLRNHHRDRENPVVRILAAAQTEQDFGGQWGTAADAAHRTAEINKWV